MGGCGGRQAVSGGLRPPSRTTNVNLGGKVGGSKAKPRSQSQLSKLCGVGVWGWGGVWGVCVG